MSNVYILPRRGNSTAAATAATGANQQQQQRHQQQLLQKPVHQFPTNQPQIVVVGGSQGGPITRSLPALPGHKPGSRFVRSTAQLGSSQIRNSSSSRLFSQPHPSRLPMTAARRVYMATPATKPAHQPQHVQIVQHNQPSMLASHSRRAQQLKKAAAAQMVIVDQSEEDEFDVDEVYQLLEESAGHRMTDEAALPRRRERLTNLTAEEKMDRRKQKNRIAAQAARDRKKETTKKLEDSLKRALLEIGKLKNEVKALRSANAQLADENHGFEGGKSAAVELAYGRPQQQFHQAHGPEDQNFVDLQELKPATTNYPPMHHSHQPIVHQGQYQHQGQPKMRPMQQRVDSLGSAESFSGPQQRERETAQQQRQQPNWPMAEMEVERASEMVLPSDRWRRPVKMGNKERSWRMACFVKILMALSAMVPSKKEEMLEAKEDQEETVPEATMKTSDCSKFSMSFLKNWKCPSMWTASATKSLRRALLRKMLTMDRVKLLKLSKCPQRQLVAHLLVRKEANRKARGRQRSLTPMGDISNSIQSNISNQFAPKMDSPMELQLSTPKSDQEETMASAAAIVPQMTASASSEFPQRH